jgi:signal transduction histidine kinase
MTQHLHLESITTSYHALAESNHKLRQALDRQKELDRLKTSFLAMLSHELRTPLTSIIGYSEMLMEGMVGELQPEQMRYISTIMEKGESLLELISSLLQISKVEAGVLELEVDHCDVSEVLGAAQRSVVPAAQRRNLTLDIKAAPDAGPILADRDKVVQCVTNLLSNAIKFTPPNGRIEVNAYWFDGERRYSGDAGGRFGATRERFLRIDVSDTGIGIPADKVQQVFRAFYQVDNSFTREFGGVGLGLAIVKSFVDAHGGEVWVTSHEGQGTTFSLLFPPRAERAARVDVP